MKAFPWPNVSYLAFQRRHPGCLSETMKIEDIFSNLKMKIHVRVDNQLTMLIVTICGRTK